MADDNFIAAIEMGDAGAVRYFLTSRGGTVTLDSEVDPILLGVNSGSVEVVKLLIQNCGAKIRKVYSEKQCFQLMMAAGTKQTLDILQLVIEQVIGASNINSADSHGRTILVAAVQSKQYKTISFLLKYRSLEINKSDNDKNTAVHWASRLTDLQVLQQLLSQKKIRLDLRNKNGETPFHQVISCDSSESIDCLQLLLSAAKVAMGDIEVTNQDGLDVLQHALVKGNINAVTLLLSHPGTKIRNIANGRNMILELAWRIGVQAVKLVLAAGITNSENPEQQKVELLIKYSKKRRMLLSNDLPGLSPEDEEEYRKMISTPGTLLRLSMEKVRQVLIENLFPCTILPAVQMLVNNGEIPTNLYRNFLYDCSVV
ncbi:histone-lysine N-methyltransferase EHMT2 [Eurytemora carolleeae]|uniref:histone-lysine N-methyltransferase EHMT2 n=1 Tax=Eurytemora carolleeae TaxID=1294199 RepID=UPI000C75BE54|nr:histone-lysine N-methyltransferase EHMT2 [Eurytemora carolleeae]|eukprot:XP_023337263.1 histone-lysine N-methyltransferase EHMT2-like [Eurytemora affinis]